MVLKEVAVSEKGCEMRLAEVVVLTLCRSYAVCRGEHLSTISTKAFELAGCVFINDQQPASSTGNAKVAVRVLLRPGQDAVGMNARVSVPFRQERMLSDVCASGTSTRAKILTDWIRQRSEVEASP